MEESMYLNYVNKKGQQNRSNLILPKANHSLSQIIINSIVDDLLAARLKPGDKLPIELELCEQFGVSRNTVREAIKMLVVLGVVNIRRGDGTYVSENISSMSINPMLLGLALEPRTSKEIIELRQLLDAGASELLIDKADDEDFDLLEQLNNNILDKMKTATVDEIYEMDLHFHKTFHELTQNRLLVYIYQTIYEMFAISIKKSVEHNPISVYNNHAEIISALRERNKEKVKNVVANTLSDWKTVIGKEDDKI